MMMMIMMLVMTKIMVGGSHVTEPMTVCFLFVPGADWSMFYVRGV